MDFYILDSFFVLPDSHRDTRASAATRLQLNQKESDFWTVQLSTPESTGSFPELSQRLALLGPLT